jgi:hypothetical protein
MKKPKADPESRTYKAGHRAGVAIAITSSAVVLSVIVNGFIALFLS